MTRNLMKTITLNSKNCDGDDHLLYTNLEEQLQKKKEIRKCHHQKHVNTRTVINNNIKKVVA